MADSPYFDSAYFDAADFDTDTVTAAGHAPKRVVFLPAQPDYALLDDELLVLD